MSGLTDIKEEAWDVPVTIVAMMMFFGIGGRTLRMEKNISNRLQEELIISIRKIWMITMTEIR